jgi:hypothetical protein
MGSKVFFLIVQNDSCNQSFHALFSPKSIALTSLLGIFGLAIKQFTILNEKEMELLIQEFKRDELSKLEKEKQNLINQLEKEKKEREYNQQLMWSD